MGRKQAGAIGMGDGRPRVVILGAGWGSVKLLGQLAIDAMDVTVVAPRGDFVFTPLLPSICGGGLKGSACAPRLSSLGLFGQGKAQLREGRATAVDFAAQTVAVAETGGETAELAYDALVVATGAETATFGTPGVAEHAFFLRTPEEGRAVFRRVMDNFEHAAKPDTSPEDRKRLLHFAMVGGGPTGVEVAAELHDLIASELETAYPSLKGIPRISLYEAGPGLLRAYHPAIQEFVVDHFSHKLGIDVKLGTGVSKLAPDAITVKDRDSGAETSEPIGLCMWATGIAPNALTTALIDKLPAQAGKRFLATSPHCEVIGAENVYAIGDCSRQEPESIAAAAGRIGQAVTDAGIGYPYGVTDLKKVPDLAKAWPHFAKLDALISEGKIPKTLTGPEDLAAALTTIEAAWCPPPPTAQSAKGQGETLAGLLNGLLKEGIPIKDQQCHVDVSKGALAYVGGGQAVADMPGKQILGGRTSGLIWSAVYLSMQPTWCARSLMLKEYARVKWYGRRDNLNRT